MLKGRFKNGFITLFFLCYALHGLNQSELIINEYMASNASTIMDSTGQTHDWIELKNIGNSPIDLSNFFISDDLNDFQKWTIPDTTIAANGILLLWASGLNEIDQWNGIHTNFSINSDGEGIYLSDPSGMLIDASPPDYLGPDISLGRIEGELNWYYFEDATPGYENGTDYYSDQTQEPQLSHTSGFYENEFDLQLTGEHPDDVIKYTLDGSEPYQNSQTYDSPIEIEENTVIRIKVLRENALSTRIYTYTYLFDLGYQFDVISLVSDHENLFGSQGIYTLYTSGQEIPIHLEYFNTNGTLAFRTDLGVRIHAPDSREQKSLRLYMRSEYGENELSYQLFEEKNINSFKRLVLRNGGNDGSELNQTHIRDAFVHELYRQQNSENGYAAYKPVHTFINGEYWGIYNLRERQDEHFMQVNFGYSPDEIDFLEYDYTSNSGMNTICGDWEDFDSLKTFIIEQDLSLDENYEIVQGWMDIENFIDYQIFQIHIGNQDWLNNNIRFWKPQNGGKWKWVLWDTDYGLGTYTTDPIGFPDFDFMNMALTWGGWGNEDYTWMLRNLVENEKFKEHFINRYQDLLNSTFLPGYLVQEFDEIAENLSVDMLHQLSRWGNSWNSWQASLDHAKYFMQGRHAHSRFHLTENLEIPPETSTIVLDVSDDNAGIIQINTLEIDHDLLGWQDDPYPWTGEYFVSNSIQLNAIPHQGYQFSHWTGSLEQFEPGLELFLTEPTSLTAVFTPVGNTPTPPIVINELMTQNATVYPDESGEYETWIELYNTSDSAINIAGIYVTNDFGSPLNWQILSSAPELTTIEPHGHLVLFADLNVFVNPLHLNFSLDESQGKIGLYFVNGNGDIVYIDSIEYGFVPENHSYGRQTDGSDEWIIFDSPTPHAPNEIISEVPLQLTTEQTKVYPVPASEKIFVHFPSETIGDELIIYDVSGKRVTFFENRDRLRVIDVSLLDEGIYILNIRLKGKFLDSKRFVKH